MNKYNENLIVLFIVSIFIIAIIVGIQYGKLLEENKQLKNIIKIQQIKEWFYE